MMSVPAFSLDLKAMPGDAAPAPVQPVSFDPAAPATDAVFGRLLSGLTVPSVEPEMAVAIEQPGPGLPEGQADAGAGEEAPETLDEVALALPEFVFARTAPPAETALPKLVLLPDSATAKPAATATLQFLPNPVRSLIMTDAPVAPTTLPVEGDVIEAPEFKLAGDRHAKVSEKKTTLNSVIAELTKSKPQTSGKTPVSVEISRMALADAVVAKPVSDAIAARSVNEAVAPAKPIKADAPSLVPASAPLPAASPFDVAALASVVSMPVTGAAEPQPVADAISTDIGGRLGDQAIQTRLDIANESQWMDRVARDIAQFAGKDGSLKFQLNPENLGSLHVEITHAADGVSLRFGTETEGARNVLADAQQRLANEARAQGVRIAETHIDFGNHNNGSGNKAPQTQPQIITQGQAQGAEPAEKARSKPLERFA